MLSVFRLLIFVMVFGLPMTAISQQPAAPSSAADSYVVDDRANLLSEEELVLVETILKDHNNSNFGFIRLVILPSLPEGVTIKEMADTFLLQETADPEARQDRIWLLISLGDRKLRIATAELVWPVLSDEACVQIIEGQIVPRFRKNEFYAGIRAGLTAIITMLKGGRFASAASQETP